MAKLTHSFYQKSAIELAPLFLGKFLVHNTPKGVISGMITDVEAYPANTDEVSHGNKRTKRIEILYGTGGFSYVYLIYGIHHQFAVVVNKKDIPEVVFIRAVKPEKGIDLMFNNFGKEVKNIKQLTHSPGNLCKSFSINLDYYGEDLTKDRLYIEDRGIKIPKDSILSSKRQGINPKRKGADSKIRYFVSTYP